MKKRQVHKKTLGSRRSLEVRFCISFWFIRNEMQEMSS